jgi:hypothetical protein
LLNPKKKTLHPDLHLAPYARTRKGKTTASKNAKKQEGIKCENEEMEMTLT